MYFHWGKTQRSVGLGIQMNLQVPQYIKVFHTVNVGLFYYYTDKTDHVIWENMFPDNLLK